MPAIRRVACAVLMSLCAASALAWGKEEVVFHPPTPEELGMTSVPSAPGAHAVILQWDHRQDDSQNWESEYVRIKIFDREALNYANVQAEFIAGHSWVKRLEARTIHADGTIIPFDGKTYDKLLAKHARTSIMARTFTLPDVQPGSIIEYYYLRDANGLRLAPAHWILQHQLPVLKETIWFVTAHNLPSYFVVQGLGGKTPKFVDWHYELALENIPPFEDEPYSPPAHNAKARIDFFYTLTNLTGDEYWKVVGKSAAHTIKNDLSDSRLIRKTAEELVNGATTPDEKLRRIYARMQQLHNVSYDPPKTEQEQERSRATPNRDVDEALIKGYGTSWDINNLFISLALAAGLDAHVAWAASRDERFFAQQIPDFSQLDHELTVVTIDGKDRFFDPGTPMAPFGILAWEVTGVPAMKLLKDEGVFVRTPHLDPSEAIVRRKADLRIDNGTVKGTVTVTYHGEQALQRRMLSRNDDEAATRKALEEVAKSWLPQGSAVKLKTFGAMKAVEEPFRAEYDVELPNLASFGGSRVLVPLAVFSASQKNPFTAKERKHDIYYDYESTADDEIVLTLPDGYVVESLPAAAEKNLGGLAFRNAWSRDEHSVSLKRTFTLNTFLIAKSNYDRVRGFYESAIAADQETVILKH